MSGTALQEQLMALADVPTLVVAAGPPTTAAERGTVLLVHEPRYASAPERLRYLEYPGEHHMLSKRVWPRLGEGARLVRTLPERLEPIRQP